MDPRNRQLEKLIELRAIECRLGEDRRPLAERDEADFVLSAGGVRLERGDASIALVPPSAFCSVVC